ncbi:hypothetical protein [Caudoviricetes sp.]|nr:hypothetical protein [Caudoviricetes sp.]
MKLVRKRAVSISSLIAIQADRAKFERMASRAG